MSVVSNNILAGASGQGGAAAAAFEIERSLRFNSGDSSFLSRTPSSAGNRKTWTWSGWVKIVDDTEANIFNGGTSGSNDFSIRIDNGQLCVQSYTGSWVWQVKTTALFRDPSAWYHFLVSFDSTHSTSADRIKIYVNGVQHTNFSTSTYPSQNLDSLVNSTVSHTFAYSPAYFYSSFYLADVHFIDGQALAPTDFGLTDSNGVWQPKKYTGSYGTNGFHLEFKNNSSNAALGTDTSGNNNTWTVNNLVATAGLETSNQGFDAVTYTGTASTQSITSLAFQPDFVWLKRRNGAGNHNLQDVVRGASAFLQTDGNGAESSSGSRLASFDSNGFTLTSDNGGNASGGTYIAWAWKAGGAAVSNTDGTITSSVSVNTSYGFSIASYTGTGSTATWGHGLNSAPELVIVKSRSDAQNWAVYSKHTSGSASPAEEYGFLNSTNAFSSSGAGFFWNNTLPTSSVVTVGSDNTVNGSSKTYIAYCWSEVSGFSKFGSYTGNGSATGPVVTTDFKPKFVLIKESSAAGQSWQLHDAARGGNKYLQANSSAAESTFTSVEFNNSGFSIKTSDNGWNRSGGTYIYAAFADKPPGEITDSLIDTPTNAETPTDTGVGGEIKGNYCIWNPLFSSTGTYTEGNLQLLTTAGNRHYQATFGLTSGKWYWEIEPDSGSTPGMIGIALGSKSPTANLNGDSAMSYYSVSGNKQGGNTSGVDTSYGATFTYGDIIGVALDLDSGTKTLTFYKNGVSQGVAFNPDVSLGSWFPAVSSGSSVSTTTFIANFGQRAFAYTAPSGFKALCSANLSDPTISDPSQYFDTKLYTGNASSNTISGLNFSPDLLWLKSRGSAQSHALFDLVRGSGQRLQSNATSAEDAYSSFFTGFTSDGFTLNQSSGINLNNDPLVAWAWDAGTSTVTNNDGSVASQVRANPSAGFSIVTGSGNSGTYGHGLNAKPDLVIVKQRNGAVGWAVTHSALGTMKDNIIYLNGASANTNSSNFWGSSNFDSSVFPVSSNICTSGATFVAYCFTSVNQYSSFGLYTGNNDDDGPFVYTGFRPRWLMIKRTDSTGNWFIIDALRSPFNEVNDLLYAELSIAETSNDSNNGIDFLSNGFKLRKATGGTNINISTLIYAAFAENPFKTARAR